MGTIGDLSTFIKEVMTLTDRVGGLKTDVERLMAKVENNTERIIKLESREELLIEKMTRHATEAVHRMSDSYYQRLANIERRLGPTGPEPKGLTGN
ncbi:MAG: hypothetical protein ACFFCW_41925 [Candidatus Hodarchaeota archaeon]